MDDLTRLLFEGLKDTMEEAKRSDSLIGPLYGRPKQMTIEDLEAKLNESSSDDDSDEEDEDEEGEDDGQESDEEVS
jgi:hypothetical protein